MSEASQIKERCHPALRWMALLAPFITLITIFFGALTTTKDAGMAFADWPGSDGHNMLLYPWFKLFSLIQSNQDAMSKFLEHGHRLAGIWIGLHCIGLTVVAFLFGTRMWVKWLSVVVLLSIIAQGLLGGYRVLLVDRGLAMIHGLAAAFVFSLICFMSLVTSSGWFQASAHQEGEFLSERSLKSLKRMRWLSITTVVLLSLQYILGGMLRHHGMGLNEHLGFGFLALFFCLTVMLFAVLSSIPWIRNAGVVLGFAIVGQFALGLMAFLVKFGFPSWGIQAVRGSMQEVYIRTFHMMGGVLVMAAAFLLLAKVIRLCSVGLKISPSEGGLT